MSDGGHIRVLIVDDHEMVRIGLKAILQAEPDLQVVGETGAGAEVAELVADTSPDLVLLDARLPDTSGPEVCRQLQRSHPQIPVIILSSYTDDELVEECVVAGARGYVVKDIERFSLSESIRAVHAGQAVLAPQVAGRILDRMRDRANPVADPTVLNRSQVAILRLVRRGYSNREIAAEVHLSENTVKTHLQDVFRKLGARNRVEAAMLAAERRWI
jgi:two-component system, NarL family, response regulator DevR